MSLEKIEAKIEKLDERLDAMDKHFAVNNALLAEHIKRTEAAEKRIEKNETAIVQSVSKINRAQGAFAFGGWLIALSIAVLTLISRLK